LLSENHHKINLIAGEDLLLIEGVIPLLWIISYTTSLSDPRLAIVIGQSWCSSQSACFILTPLLSMPKVVLFYTQCRIGLIAFIIDLLDVTVAHTC
jgi:hypothetical protein